MEVGYAWSISGSPTDLEKELNEFTFKGPGLYLTNIETLLVVPSPPDEAPTAKNIWNKEQPKGTIYTAYLYDCRAEDHIFSVIATCPIHEDTR